MTQALQEPALSQPSRLSPWSGALTSRAESGRRRRAVTCARPAILANLLTLFHGPAIDKRWTSAVPGMFLVITVELIYSVTQALQEPAAEHPPSRGPWSGALTVRAGREVSSAAATWSRPAVVFLSESIWSTRTGREICANVFSVIRYLLMQPNAGRFVCYPLCVCHTIQALWEPAVRRDHRASPGAEHSLAGPVEVPRALRQPSPALPVSVRCTLSSLHS